MATASKTWSWDAGLEDWVLNQGQNSALTRDTTQGSPSNGSLKQVASGRAKTGTSTVDLTTVSWASLFGLASSDLITAVQVAAGTRTYVGLSNWLYPASWAINVYANLDSAERTLFTRSGTTTADGSWQTGAAGSVYNLAASIPASTLADLAISLSATTAANSSAAMSLHFDYLTITVTYTPVRTGTGSAKAKLPKITGGATNVEQASNAPSYVNSSSVYQQATLSLTGVTIGNLLVAIINGRQSGGNFACASTAGTVNSKADGTGNSGWTEVKEKLGTQDSTGADINIFYGYAQTSGTHTIQGSGGSDIGHILLEYTKVAKADPIDNTTDGIGTFGGAGVPVSQTAFTVAPNTTVVAGFTEHSTGCSYTPQNSFVERQDLSTATEWAGDLKVEAGGSITPSVAPSTSTAAQWVGVAMSIKGLTSNGGSKVQLPSITGDATNAGGSTPSNGDLPCKAQLPIISGTASVERRATAGGCTAQLPIIGGTASSAAAREGNGSCKVQAPVISGTASTVIRSGLIAEWFAGLAKGGSAPGSNTDIVEVGAVLAQGTSGTALSITHGLTIQAGDIVIAQCYAQYALSGQAISDNNGAYAFDLLLDSNNYTGASIGNRLCYRVAGSSEPATYNWTAAQLAPNWAVLLRVFRNVDPNNPWDVRPSEATRQTSTSAASAVTTDMTIVTPGALGLAFLSTDGNLLRYTAATNWGNELEPSSGNDSIASYTRTFVAAGAIGTQTFGMSATNDYCAILGALRPARVVWDDLTGQHNGTLLGFTLDGSTDGWVGDGTAATPYGLKWRDLDNDDDRVEVGSGWFDGLSAFTVEAWVQLPSAIGANAVHILGNFDAMVAFISVQNYQGIQLVTTGGDSGAQTAPDPTFYNSRQHFVWTYDDADDWIRYYDDGVQNSGDLTLGGTVVSTARQMVIGNRVSDLLRTFRGTIYTVRVYNRALSAAEVTRNFNAGVLGHTAPTRIGTGGCKAQLPTISGQATNVSGQQGSGGCKVQSAIITGSASTVVTSGLIAEWTGSLAETNVPGVVSIEVDDGNDTDYTIMFPALETAGLVGGFGPIYNRIGQAGRTTAAQLLEMEAAGHEILCQTYTHDAPGPQNISDFIHESRDAKAALEALGLTIYGWSPSGSWWPNQYFPEIPTNGWTPGGPAELVLQASFDYFLGQLEHNSQSYLVAPVDSQFRWGGWYGGALGTKAATITAIDGVRHGMARNLQFDGMGQGGISSQDWTDICTYLAGKVASDDIRVVLPWQLYCPEFDTYPARSLAPGNNTDKTALWADIVSRHDFLLRVVGFVWDGTTNGWVGSGTANDAYRLRLDGTTDCYADADVTAYTDKDFTFECWATVPNGTISTVQQIIVERGSSADHGGGAGNYPVAYLGFNNSFQNQLYGYVRTVLTADPWTTYTATGRGAVTFDGAMHHLVMTVTAGGTVKVYVDGVLGTLAENNTPASGVLHHDYDIRIGGMPGSTLTTYPYPGDIATIRIYDRPLTQAEITRNFNAGILAHGGIGDVGSVKCKVQIPVISGQATNAPPARTADGTAKVQLPLITGDASNVQGSVGNGGPKVQLPVITGTASTVVTSGLVGEWFAGLADRGVGPGRVNWVQNPSFETNVGYWGWSENCVGAPTYTRVADATAPQGGYACELAYVGQAGDATSYAHLRSGNTIVGSAGQNETWTVSAWLRLTGTNSGCTYKIGIVERDAAGTYLREDNSPALSVDGTWQRFSYTVALVNASVSRLQASIQAIDVAEGDQFDLLVDGVMLEKSGSVGMYFDGNTPGFSWSGGTPWTSWPVSKWDDLISNRDGVLTGFALDSTGRWVGSGTAADPYGLKFDDVDTVVDLGDPIADGDSSTIAVTLEVWFACPTESGQSNVFIDLGRTTDVNGYPAVAMYTTTAHHLGGMVRNDAGGTTSRASATTEDDGAIHHAVITQGSGVMKLYHDGSQVDTDGAPGGTFTFDKLILGARVSNPNALHYNGTIYTARVYDRALTPTEVQRNFDAGVLGHTAPKLNAFGSAKVKRPKVTGDASNIGAGTGSGSIKVKRPTITAGATNVPPTLTGTGVAKVQLPVITAAAQNVAPILTGTGSVKVQLPTLTVAAGNVPPARTANGGAKTKRPTATGQALNLPAGSASGSAKTKRPTITAAGTVANPARTGNGSTKVQLPVISGQGTVVNPPRSADLPFKVKRPTITAQATNTPPVRTGNLPFKVQLPLVTGDVTNVAPIKTGDGTAKLKKVKVTAQATNTPPVKTGNASFKVQLPLVTAQGTVVNPPRTATGSAKVKRPKLEGLSIHGSVGNGGPKVKRPRLTGGATNAPPTWTGSGTCKVQSAVVTGTAQNVPPARTASGSCKVKSPVLRGTGYGNRTATAGGCKAQAAIVSGTATNVAPIVPASGSAKVQSATLHGTAINARYGYKNIDLVLTVCVPARRASARPTWQTSVMPPQRETTVRRPV